MRLFTYRRRLFWKRFFLVVLIILLVLAAATLLGFRFLDRYLVYTETGAHFSFSEAAEAPSETTALPTVGEIVLETGAPTAPATPTPAVEAVVLPAEEVNGYLVDYATLSEESATADLSLSSGTYNTVVLEVCQAGGALLTETPYVQQLISDLQAQDIHVAALMPALSDSDYAVAHMDESLAIAGGALWMSPAGAYWMDPGNDTVAGILTDRINAIASAGIDEVILSDYDLPESDSIVYDMGEDDTRESLIQADFERLSSSVGCTLGVLITDYVTDSPLADSAAHIYVAMDQGTAVSSYSEAHSDAYLVFVTSSHDTRFTGHGVIYTPESLSTAADNTEDTEDGETAPDELEE